MLIDSDDTVFFHARRRSGIVPASVRFKGGGGGASTVQQKELAAAEKERLQNTDRMLAIYEEVFAPEEKALLYHSMGVTDPSRVEPLDESINTIASKLGTTRNTLTDIKKSLTDSGISESDIPTSLEEMNSDEWKATVAGNKNLSSTFKTLSDTLTEQDGYKTELTAAREARNTEIGTQRKALSSVQTDMATSGGLAYATGAQKNAEESENRAKNRYGIDESKLSAGTQEQLASSRELTKTTNKVATVNIGIQGAQQNRDALESNTVGLGANNSAAAEQLKSQGLAYGNASASAYNQAYQYGQQATANYGQMWGQIGQSIGYGLLAGAAVSGKTPSNSQNNVSVPVQGGSTAPTGTYATNTYGMNSAGVGGLYTGGLNSTASSPNLTGLNAGYSQYYSGNYNYAKGY